MCQRRKMTAEELAVLRDAFRRNAIQLDGVDELSEDERIGNSKTAQFVESEGADGIDAAFDLIEFILTDPEDAYFSPAHDRQRRDGSFILEEDAWVLKRWSPKYRSRCFLKIWHLYSDATRKADVHPY